MPISYSLTTPAVDIPYELSDLFADPPTSLNELFRQLSYGELGDLKAGLDGAGNIKPERRNQVIHQANEGLKDLHHKFQLIRESKEVVVPESQSALEVTFPLGAFQVISLLVPEGSLTFHTHPVPGHIYVFNQKLLFPANCRKMTVQVTYQKDHPVLARLASLSDTDPGLEQPIYLTKELWPALRAYIAGEIYGNMNTVDAKNASREYRGRYAQICAEVEARGGTPQGMLDDQKFDMRGFV